MRTKQFVASIMYCASSIKTYFYAHLAASRKIMGIFHLESIKIGFQSKIALLLMFPSLAVILLMLEESHPLPNEIQISKASFLEKEKVRTTSSFVLDEVPSDIEALTKEALVWLSVLNSFDDFSLTTEQLMKKFKNMSIAYTILSSTSEGSLKRRYWSEQAIQYGRYSLGVLEGMMPDRNVGEIEEVNTRLLIAMAINYYEDGKVQQAELISQFEKISKSFLVRTGFCNNRILKSLADDQIIKLPNYLTQKYI